MIRGTTEEFRFKIPYTQEEVQSFEITFWQKGLYGTAEHPFPINKTELSPGVSWYDANTIKVVLTADETLRFTDKLKGYAQFAGCTINNFTFSHIPTTYTVYPLRTSIDVDDIMPSKDGIIILDGDVVS